jgi:hypothetical protein
MGIIEYNRNQGRASSDDMYFHLTCEGHPVIRGTKSVEILENNSMRTLVSVKCDDVLSNKGRVYEKSELLKSQIDILVKPKQYIQFAASKMSKHRLF